MQKLVLRPVVPSPAPAEALPDSSGTVLRYRIGDLPECSVFLPPENLDSFREWLRVCEEGEAPNRGKGNPASLFVYRVGPAHAEWVANRPTNRAVEPLQVGDEFASIAALARHLKVFPQAVQPYLKRGYGETSKLFGVEIQFNADMRD